MSPESEAAEGLCKSLSAEFDEVADQCFDEREQAKFENLDPKPVCRAATELERDASRYYREHVQRTEDRADRICDDLEGVDCAMARSMYSSAFSQYWQFHQPRAEKAKEQCAAVKKAVAAKKKRNSTRANAARPTSTTSAP